MTMSKNNVDSRPIASASDVARYFLALAIEDGDFISNLKMQKLVHYAYAYTLALHHRRLFGERIEAWPTGPVVPVLYEQLKRYGARPIDPEFLDTYAEGDIESTLAKLRELFPEDVLETLNGVYETYMPRAAFELVLSSSVEKPWVEARRGLDPTDRGSAPILDEHIIETFSK